MGFWVGKHIKMLGGQCTWRGYESSGNLSTNIVLCISSISLFVSSVFYNKLVNIS